MALKALLAALRLVNPRTGYLDRSTAFGFFCGLLAAFSVVASKSLSVEAVTLLTMAGAHFVIDKKHGSRVEQAEADREQLLAKVASLTTAAQAAVQKADSVEAALAPIKEQITVLKNRAGK